MSVTALFIAATFYMVFGSTGTNNFFSVLSHQEAVAQQPAQEQPATTVEIPLSKGYIDGKIELPFDVKAVNTEYCKADSFSSPRKIL
ncbi:MAG TPA: hypothetical protein VJ799_04760 [Nitrososphaeraceae archaeon]|nr:hypothetical protein [Nitrososphaeraceae archaeon]